LNNDQLKQQIQDAKSVQELFDIAILMSQETFSPTNNFELLYAEWDRKYAALQEKRLREIVREEIADLKQAAMSKEVVIEIDGEKLVRIVKGADSNEPS
jgi:hypothetical protein